MDKKSACAAQSIETPAPVVVLMGVSGCGKTVVGRGLAETLDCLFVEGDDLHPPENVERMRNGIPLDDAHREGWLDALGARIADAAGDGGVIAACSALKRKYRERLRRFSPSLRFIYLRIDKATAWRRVAGRKGHFMPANLVDSQFETLEPLEKDEAGAVVDATPSVREIVQEATRLVRRWRHEPAEPDS